jgi:hypothetical protein
LPKKVEAIIPRRQCAENPGQFHGSFFI